MPDPIDREMIYSLLYEEVALYKNSNERALYERSAIELLTRVSALTDAVLYDKLTPSEAKFMLRTYIESLRIMLAEPEKKEDEGPGAFEEGKITF